MSGGCAGGIVPERSARRVCRIIVAHGRISGPPQLWTNGARENPATCQPILEVNVRNRRQVQIGGDAIAPGRRSTRSSLQPDYRIRQRRLPSLARISFHRSRPDQCVRGKPSKRTRPCRASSQCFDHLRRDAVWHESSQNPSFEHRVSFHSRAVCPYRDFRRRSMVADRSDRDAANVPRDQSSLRSLPGSRRAEQD